MRGSWSHSRPAWTVSAGAKPWGGPICVPIDRKKESEQAACRTGPIRIQAFDQVATRRQESMNLSIIIPFHNEEENAEAVIGEVFELHPDAEIVTIDDGSTDNTSAVLSQIRGIKVITLPRRTGQSGALYRGLMEARGDILVLMDGDGQSSTPDIERLLKYIPEYDFVNGLRTGRRDSLARRLSFGQLPLLVRARPGPPGLVAVRPPAHSRWG